MADFHLLVMLLWADKFGLAVPAPLADLRVRLKALTSVQVAMHHEGLS